MDTVKLAIIIEQTELPQLKKLNFCFQVYKLSIGAVCGLSWPSDRLVVQVLDDSTNPVLRVFD